MWFNDPIMLFFEAYSSMGCEMGKVSWSIRMEEFMKVSGLMIKEQEAGMKGTQMETGMRDRLKRVRLTEKEFITGTLEKCMMESGNMELKKEMVFGKELMAILILENGRTQKPMAMECILGRMGTGMKENG